MGLWSTCADLIYPVGLEDPAGWGKARLGVTLWSKQCEIAESVRDHAETAVKSCHNAGKSFDAAFIVCWWLDTHPPGSAFAVTTAPTGHQVKAILWREINRMHAKGLPGRVNLTEWYVGNEIVAFGRKPNDYEPTAFQGIHEEFVLVVLDEACGIPTSLWDAASSMTSNDGSRTLAIGNPDDPNSEFARVCKPDSGWNVITIAAKDTPNWTGEDVPHAVKKNLISKGWVASRAKKWGKDSGLYRSKVDGEFPDATADATRVIPWSYLAPCQSLDLPACEPREGGLDLGASTGGDRTVLIERAGTRINRRWEDHTPDAMELVGTVVMKINEWGLTKLKVDSIGAGWGVASRLQELSSVHNPSSPDVTHECEVVPVGFGDASNEPARFLNLRAEVYWHAREVLRLQQVDVSALTEDDYGEITAAHFIIMDSKGRIKIEPKADIKKRLGVSPDVADAFVLALWPGGSVEIRSGLTTVLSARLPGAYGR